MPEPRLVSAEGRPGGGVDVELALSRLDSLPTLPAVAVRLLQVTCDSESAVSDVVRLLSADQSLTARILAVASSASLGVRAPVHTLERAVVLLGFLAVRGIVLAVKIFESFPRHEVQGADGAFDRVEFWKHALAVGCAARRIARARRELGVDPEDAFVAGLLHDLGKVALDAVFPKAYARIAARADHARGDIADSERVVLGTDHTLAGRRLAERWGLPRDIQEVIWLHHLSSETLPSSINKPHLVAAIQLADTLVREQRIGYSGNHIFYEPSRGMAQRLGVPDEELDKIAQALVAEVVEFANLLGLDRETPEAVYLKALTRANAELGRLNSDLIESNRRLAASARYFRGIARCDQLLKPQSDLSAVVAALASAGSVALQRPQLLCFGVREHNLAIEVNWLGGDPGVGGTQTLPVSPELAGWLADPGDCLDAFLVHPPRRIRTLLADWLDRLGAGEPWLLPIVHGERVAGGLLFVSDRDERARLAAESDDLRSFLASLGLALARANAQAAARHLSDDLAETNRRLQQTQTELLQKRALSMIAEMAAGAGHELNSPLTVISGRAQMLEQTSGDADAQRCLRLIRDKAHECSQIVNELMDFARPRAPQWTQIRLPELLNELRDEWVERAHPAPLHVELTGDDETDKNAAPLIRCDREQLKAVFRELLANATEALGEKGGTIAVQWRALSADDSVKVTVQDAGCGMQAEVLRRAFDPFYSQRRAGRGRGLGLARAHRVVETHNGKIWLESQAGAGTTAYVVLPCVRCDRPEAGPPMS